MALFKCLFQEKSAEKTSDGGVSSVVLPPVLSIWGNTLTDSSKRIISLICVLSEVPTSPLTQTASQPTGCMVKMEGCAN